jgi:hypothetical protein
VPALAERRDALRKQVIVAPREPGRREPTSLRWSLVRPRSRCFVVRRLLGFRDAITRPHDARRCHR